MEPAFSTPPTVGERLRAAIKSRGPKSIRAFQRLMAKRRVVGSTAPSINSYLQNAAAPSLAFLEAAAEVLGVSKLWLAFGHGPMVALGGDEDSVSVTTMIGPLDEVYFAFPQAHPEFLNWPSHLNGMFYQALHSWLDGAPDRDRLTLEDAMRAADDLYRMILTPLHCWGFSNPETRTVARFVEAMLHALMIAMADPGKGEPIRLYPKNPSSIPFPIVGAMAARRERQRGK